MKTIKISLSCASVDDAIKELKAYKARLLDKTELFVKKLAEAGIPVVDQNMSAAGRTQDEKGIESGSDTSHNTYVKVNSFGDFTRADLITEGREILFIEFGAGVHHNGAVGSSPNPHGSELGFTIGSYGKGYGKRDTWAYDDGSGAIIRTHGTKATMPMYKAHLEMKDKFVSIAKEVFEEK